MTDANIVELSEDIVTTMQAWGDIAEKAKGRQMGARFGAILATYDAETGSIASPRAIERTGVASKSTVSREGNVALAVASALGSDNLPTPSASHADALAVFSKLAGALGKIPATHRAGILERLGAHADNLAELVKRAEALLIEATEAREAESRGARPEGNKPAEEEAAAEVAESPAAEPAPVSLADALAVVSAHLQAHPNDVDTLDALQSMIDEAWQVVLA